MDARRSTKFGIQALQPKFSLTAEKSKSQNIRELTLEKEEMALFFWERRSDGKTIRETSFR